MGNLDIYRRVQSVPESAQKTIGAGRLKGFTDINPMWRIKTLTEEFGPCGVGWVPEIVKYWLEDGANETKTAHMVINLFVKINGEWSKPIPGIGGASYISQEKSGAYTSDECFKMAFTDAVSVACKLLGFGADVYWMADRTKYNTAKETAPVEVNRKALNLTVRTLMGEFGELRGKAIGEVENALLKQIKAPEGMSLETISDELALRAKTQIAVWLKAAKEQSNETDG